MGYILPIHHFQYQDYQQRVTQDKRSPIILDRVFKVTLDHKLKKYYIPNEQDQKDSQSLHYQLHTPPTMYYNEESQVEKEIYGQITGKGQHFSKTI
ncbi:hypothetical protein [Halobacillus sp. Marseille-P3879]|uniref:hypothetical protein n=1 Tax=Halobacillus sp. Marseille-P3879 TaxID=2045014 RepID=UPI000C79D4F5|nr:hypothetical protein [Halobacillus sp. Marseille-P3879]